LLQAGYFHAARTDYLPNFPEVVPNLSAEPVKRKAATMAPVFLQRSAFAPGDSFNIGLRAEFLIAVVGLSFVPHDPDRKARKSRGNRGNPFPRLFTAGFFSALRV
jgi:hypothetical protein